jgi:hypothetical protein
VPNFTAELVTELLLDKLARRGFRLELTVNRLQRYVRRIPERFYVQLNGSLAEKIVAHASSLQALALYTAGVEELDKRLTLSKDTMKRAINRVVTSLTRDELATVSANG